MVNPAAEEWWAGLDELTRHQALIAVCPNGVVADEAWTEFVNPAFWQMAMRRKVDPGEYELPEPYLDFVRSLATSSMSRTPVAER